jgi:hypothetical protein
VEGGARKREQASEKERNRGAPSAHCRAGFVPSSTLAQCRPLAVVVVMMVVTDGSGGSNGSNGGSFRY